MKIKNLKDKLFTCGLLAVIVVAFAVFRLPCIFKYLFHIPCAGCGMTRAYISLLQFDIIGAFKMHPMFWAMPILFIFYLFDWKLFKSKRLNHAVLILIAGGFLANWIISLLI